MSLAKILAALAVVCTGFALAAWLVLTVVVGGALVGFGGPPPRVADRPHPPADHASPADDEGAPAPSPRGPSKRTADPTADRATGAAPPAAGATRAATEGTTSTGATASTGGTAGDAADPADAPPPGTDGVSRLAVDWPPIPTLQGWTPLTSTFHFAVYAADPDDAVLTSAVQRWSPRLESILDYAGDRLGRDLPTRPVGIVFSRSYEAACPARGLAAPPDDGRTTPLILVFIGPDTSDLQIRAVLAHEMAHHLTMDDAFVGDGVLTEGIANWTAGAYALAWQGFDSWDDAARRYLADGDYVSVADPIGLVPPDGEPCIARRDRVYNVRTAFVGWLIDHYGLDTVLAMPKTTVEVDGSRGDGDPAERTVPDYAAATGDSLTQLERRWLAELTAAAPR